MRCTVSGMVLVVLAGLAPTSASSQSVPNLSGTWVLQVDKSNFGVMPGPSSRTDVIDHQEPKLTIKRTVMGSTGETTSNLVYVVDGKPYKNKVGDNELSSTLRWDGQTLVMVSTLSTPQGDVTITDRLSLSEDGKTLNQARTLSAGGESIEQTMVLTRQP